MQIERDYTLGDLPTVIETTPNLYTFSYSGGSLGATEYSIRGFNSQRIAVYVDGVPLNDPEDHTTYFVDLPDFAANIEDIQVQRGVGASMYGDAGFGGSVNIASSGMKLQRRVSLTAGYGQYLSDGKRVGDMRKQALEYSSGLIDGRWAVSGRYSKQYSDGYREKSWWDGWSYYFSASRLDPNMTTTLNVYGGPIKYHMAWYGLSRADQGIDRRYNPLEYDNQTDNFNQPHYELHNSYRLSEDVTLLNTLYYIRGKGFYEQYKSGEDPEEYSIDMDQLADTLVDEIDLVRQKWVTKHQVGWNPRLDWSHDKGRTTLGGSLYYFESTHWGQVVWAENVTSGVDPQHKYYEYYGTKYHASLFADEQYDLSDRWTLSASLQLKYLQYDFEQARLGMFTDPERFSLDWLFLSPRAGLTWHWNEATDLFFSAAVSSREPADAIIFDAEDFQAQPAIRDGKLLADPERVYDFELGMTRRFTRGHVGVNLYWMEFRDELVPSGGIDDDGQLILGNADRSAHAGVELSGGYELSGHLSLSGNLSISYNRLKEYLCYSDSDWDGAVDDTLDFSGNPIAGFPDYLGNFVLDSDFDPVRAVLRVRMVGRQYVDNTDNWGTSLGPYAVTALSLSGRLGKMADLGQLTIMGRIDNLFDARYEMTGNDWGYGGEYIPGAERNFYVQLRLEFE